MKISQFSFSFKSSRRKTNHHPPIKRPFSVLVLQSVPAPLLVVQRSAIFHATHGTSALGRVDRELRVAEKRPFSVLSPSLYNPGGTRRRSKGQLTRFFESISPDHSRGEAAGSTDDSAFNSHRTFLSSSPDIFQRETEQTLSFGSATPVGRLQTTEVRRAPRPLPLAPPLPLLTLLDCSAARLLGLPASADACSAARQTSAAVSMRRFF